MQLVPAFVGSGWTKYVGPTGFILPKSQDSVDRRQGLSKKLDSDKLLPGVDSCFREKIVKAAAANAPATLKNSILVVWR